MTQKIYNKLLNNGNILGPSNSDMVGHTSFNGGAKYMGHENIMACVSYSSKTSDTAFADKFHVVGFIQADVVAQLLPFTETMEGLGLQELDPNEHRVLFIVLRTT